MPRVQIRSLPNIPAHSRRFVDKESETALIDSKMGNTNLNLRGLKCPLPALKTRKALVRVKPGDELLVECTDPMAAVDIPNMVRETGNQLLEVRTLEEAIVFRIRKN